MEEIPRIHHKWRPIEDLPSDWRELEPRDFGGLANAWKSHLEQLRDSNALVSIREKLARQWAIETGVIEGIYSIDRGTTNLLIEKGIEASLIPHGATDKPAEDVVEILRDHEQVLEGLYDFVARKTPLSAHFIRTLHQQICAHQHEVRATDSFGQRLMVPLRLGAWKLSPNNVARRDGSTHEYCPPEHVESEIEHLLAMHEAHTEQNIPAVIEAAWLHHRFAQIHPFQDGNGRVVRCLATVILLRDHLLPFTVLREEWDRYIDALEAADAGDLRMMVELVAASHQRGVQTVQQALLETFAERTAGPEASENRVLFERLDRLAKLAEKKCGEMASKLTEQFAAAGGKNSARVITSDSLRPPQYGEDMLERAFQALDAPLARPELFNQYIVLRIKKDVMYEIFFFVQAAGELRNPEGTVVIVLGKLQSPQLVGMRQRIERHFPEGLFRFDPLAESETATENRFSRWLDSMLLQALGVLQTW